MSFGWVKRSADEWLFRVKIEWGSLQESDRCKYWSD